MDDWLTLLKDLPQDQEGLKPYLLWDQNFTDFLAQDYSGISESQRRVIERNLSTRKGLRFIDLLFEHKDPMIRRWALELADLLPGEMRIPRLLNSLDDKDEEIKLIAATKLGRMRSVGVAKALIKGLEEERWLPARVAQALSSMEDLGVPELIQLSKGDSEKLRIYAVEILGMIGSIRAGQAVLRALTDLSPEVRKTAVKASEQFPVEVIGPVLLTALTREQDIPIKILLIRTLTKLGITQAIPTLQREQHAENPKLAETARKALNALI